MRPCPGKDTGVRAVCCPENGRKTLAWREIRDADVVGAPRLGQCDIVGTRLAQNDERKSKCERRHSLVHRAPPRVPPVVSTLSVPRPCRKPDPTRTSNSRHAATNPPLGRADRLVAVRWSRGWNSVRSPTSVRRRRPHAGWVPTGGFGSVVLVPARRQHCAAADSGSGTNRGGPRPRRHRIRYPARSWPWR